MIMNILYCRTCDPVIVIVAGVCDIPAKHDTGSEIHTDIGIITKEEDESKIADFSYLESQHGSEMT